MNKKNAMLVAVSVLSVSFLGCDYFKSPTEAQCKEVVEHGAKIGLKEAGGDPNSEIAKGLIKLAVESPDAKAAIKICQDEGNMVGFKCVMAATTSAEIEACGN